MCPSRWHLNSDKKNGAAEATPLYFVCIRGYTAASSLNSCLTALDYSAACSVAGASSAAVSPSSGLTSTS